MVIEVDATESGSAENKKSLAAVVRERSLRVCFPFAGDTVGGSHLSALLLIEGLNRLGVETVVVLHRHGLLERELERRAISWSMAPLRCLVDSRSTLYSLPAMVGITKRLSAFLKEHEVDIVHLNDGRMRKTWCLAATLTGTYVVLHQRTPATSRLLGLYAWLTFANITVSEYCRRNLPGRMRSRALIIDNPFTTNAPTPERGIAKATLRREIGSEGDALITGFVGNFSERKRPLVFVEAAAKLRERLGPNIWFLMFGEPRDEMRAKVECRIRALGLEERCVLMGPRFPIEPWIAGCDLLMAPAVAEGFGRTLVEAMLVGTPVVAADDGGHREIIQDGINGRLVPPDSPIMFADAVAGVLDNPEGTKRLVATALEMARNRFSVERHAARIKEIYEEIRARANGAS